MSKRRTIPKIENFLRIFVILQIFSFLNLIINKLLEFWQFRKISKFHNWNFLLNKKNLQKFSN